MVGSWGVRLLSLKSLLAGAAFAALTLASAVSANALTVNPVVEYTSAGTLSDSRAYMLGYDFSLSSALNIDALGYWANGRSGSHQVGIWNSANALVATATVDTLTDPLIGHFRWASIAPVVLGAGTYTIAGQFLGDGTFNSDATGIVSNPAYTHITDRQEAGGFTRPTLSTEGLYYGANGIFEVSFSTSSGAVPEPATWGLMIMGFGLSGVALRSRRRMATAAI